MIQYTLKCTDGHRFDSWFQSADAYDKLAGAGMVSCAICGSSKVEKAIMTPRVRPARTTSAPEAPQQGALSEPAGAAEQALAELKRKIEETSDYVGKDFVREARAMHDGDAPERSIYGEAKPEDARALIEDGVPVTPLPFLPNRKTN
ncbi:DUF1178 family protein [Seohaeicola saemankumensis]|nr:DUF1178 family protein [Seohaeicola saemankumensis]MCA0873160.1 DUF1178 family protein [Seohaeicola saemankumensis]